jgi:putative membrane protein insertion efficiency factor
MIKRILLAFLGFYRRWLSPAIHALSPWGCRYRPTCSEYAIEAVTVHGAARGGWLALRRLLRCHPFARSGFDPVPLPHIGPYESDCATVRRLHDPLP